MSRLQPAQIVARAKSSGWVSGQHHDNDKKRNNKKYDPKSSKKQDGILRIYAVWHWTRRDCQEEFETCEARVLGDGAAVPEIHELKDFWRFYQNQSKGRLNQDGPTANTMRGQAKAFKAGLARCTGGVIGDEDTAEINSWMKHVLPYEPESKTKDIVKPKYNFKTPDLDRLLAALWVGQDLGFINERNRIQFHLQLIWFAASGGRIGCLFTAGIPYKDIDLVLERTEKGDATFFYRFNQRTLKNNKDPENKKIGYSIREHHQLCFNSVPLLITLALSDGALDQNDLTRMISGSGAGPVQWNEKAQNLPVCRQITRQGMVHPTKPMTRFLFTSIFKGLLLQEGYSYVSGSMHMIRRELGKQLDERYTDTERSQHLSQADRSVFGQSYTADTSSCDGLSAFLRERPDHTAVEYFQGIGQFRQPGLPTRLPTDLRDKLYQRPELLELERKAASATDESTKKEAKRDHQKTFKKVERKALEDHRRTRLKELRRERLFGNSQVLNEQPSLLNQLIPEKGRIAKKMRESSPTTEEDKINVMRDMLTLCKSDWSVFYRPREAPNNGACPFCSQNMEA